VTKVHRLMGSIY